MSNDIKNKMLLSRAKALKLHGVVARWEDISSTAWVEEMITWEENERSYRGLKRRLDEAKLGRFKLITEFDWSWPKKCDREAVEEFMGLSFIEAATNIIFCGPNGVGKSTLAINIAHQTVMRGHTALFTTAGNMLNDLAAQDGDNAMRRRINFYTKPQVLVIDEVGYLSYSNRHADLMFAVISNRYQTKPTIITTNKPFSEWNEIFPNASCVVSLIDRLVHNSEIVSIEAESFRLKEAKEQSTKRKESRKRNSKVTTKNTEE